MRTVHLFDQFLNRTMNWAAHLAAHTPDTQPWVAAPRMLLNELRTPTFSYLEAPWQKVGPLRLGQEWEKKGALHLLAGVENLFHPYRTFLRRQLSKDKPDLLHAHFGPVGCWALPLAQRTGIPLIVSFYGYDLVAWPQKSPAHRHAYSDLFHQAARLIALGPAGRNWLIQWGCPPEKIRIVPLGIQPAHFPMRTAEKQAGSLRLVQIAGFAPKKGQIDAVNAFAQALPDCPGITLTLAGEIVDENYFRQIKNLLSQKNLYNKISILPYLPPSGVPAVLASADILIHPSRFGPDGNSEGAPVVILEAMACGLPVLSTWHQDIPNLVAHGETGLLTDEGDVAALAEGIRFFYHLGGFTFASMSRAARERVERDFHLDRLGALLREVYREAAAPTP